MKKPVVELLEAFMRDNGLQAARARKTHHLENGVRLLTAALRADAAASEATLRLARVHMALGQDDGARELLAGLIARPGLAPSHGYLARLFLGGMHERRGEKDAAAVLYREAAALAPPGQSARLALALLLYPTDRRAAADVVEPVLAHQDSVGPNDPWSDYLLGNIPRGKLLLDELRAEVQR